MLEQFLQHPFLDALYFGNTALDYVIGFLFFLALIILVKAIQKFTLEHLANFAQKTETELDDILVKVVGSAKLPFVLFVSAYLASRSLLQSAFTEKILTAVMVLWVTYQVIVAIEIFVDHLLAKRDKESGGASAAPMHLASVVIKTIIWVFALLTALSNLGINVTSLVAGLGIGGIAVALAAQNILGDLFSSFAIYLDRPFVVGDSIKIKDLIGTVEKIGMKTTRVRALSGEEIVFPNKDIVSAQIHNFAKIKERRIVLNLNVTHETDDEKLAQIPQWIRQIIENEPNVRFDRSHFKEIGEFALKFETIYFVTSSDYVIYMNAQQNINLAIREKFKNEKVSVAYPTETIHIMKNG